MEDRGRTAPGSIIPVDKIQPVHVLNDDAAKALVHVLKERRQPRQIEPCSAVSHHPEILPRNLSTESELLKVDEASSTLQIGQRGGIASLQPLELAPARDLEFERIHELRIVPLRDTEEVHDLAVPVIDDFRTRNIPSPKEDAAHPDEGFRVKRVGISAIIFTRRGASALLPPIHAAGGCVLGTSRHISLFTILKTYRLSHRNPALQGNDRRQGRP